MDDQQKRAIDKEAFQAWLERPAVDKAITLTDEGAPPQLEQERNKFLGHPRSRIVKAFTYSQVADAADQTEIEAAFRDPRASGVFIHGDLDPDLALAWQERALELGLPARVTDSPEYRGDVGLVVVSDEALDQDDIFV